MTIKRNELLTKLTEYICPALLGAAVCFAVVYALYRPLALIYSVVFLVAEYALFSLFDRIKKIKTAGGLIYFFHAGSLWRYLYGADGRGLSKRLRLYNNMVLRRGRQLFLQPVLPKQRISARRFFCNIHTLLLHSRALPKSWRNAMHTISIRDICKAR